MASRNVYRFAKLASEDQVLAESVKALRSEGDLQAIVALGRENGCDFTLNELETCIEGVCSHHGLIRFCEIMNDDPLLADKVAEAGADVSLIVRLGQEYGCTFTAEELMPFVPGAGGELSDDQLEAVAGGTINSASDALKDLFS